MNTIQIAKARYYELMARELRLRELQEEIKSLKEIIKNQHCDGTGPANCFDEAVIRDKLIDEIIRMPYMKGWYGAGIKEVRDAVRALRSKPKQYQDDVIE
jgi:hypothetical protein